MTGHHWVQVFISHKHQMIFVRQPKSSSSAILVALEKTFADRMSKRPVFDLVSYVDDVTWMSYFVFTWVRNPFTRALSAFKMMNGRHLFQRHGVYGELVGDRCNVTLAEFAANSNSLRTACAHRGCCAYIPKRNIWVPWFIDQHINDQAHCTFTPFGESMVDFVGRTEEIDNDWAEFIAQVNRRNYANFKPKAVNVRNARGSTVKHMAEHSCDLSKVQEMLTPDVMSAITWQYASDFKYFRFLPHPAAEA